MREAFGLSSKEKLLLDERLYAKSWKTSKEKTGEGLLEGEDGEQEEEEEEEEEEVTAGELAKLVEEPKLMGRDLRSLVRIKEKLNSNYFLLLFVVLYISSSVVKRCQGGISSGR